MEYMNLSIKQLHKLLQEGKVKPSTLAIEAVEKAHKLQPKLNGFVTINDSIIEEAKKLDDQEVKGALFGIPYALKDNFSTKGILSTGSSNILKDYVPVFNAEVYDRLNNAQSLMIGKTVLDELAMGGTGLNGHTGVVHNPYNLDRISGGSSAGSAVAVASGIVPFAIGSDTGDSVRKPAAYNGLVGFKPSWGRISRFGVFPFAPSLDHVAYFTRNVEDSAYILEVLAGQDEKDMTCSTKEVEKYSEHLSSSLEGKVIGVIDEIDNSIKNSEVKKSYDEVLAKLGNKVKVFHMDLDLLKAILPTYMVISCSEATSNNANLDGIRFGIREDGASFVEQMKNTRTKGFSELVKRRFVIGSYCLSKDHQEDLFIRAQKVRRLIVDKVNEILSQCDVLLFPASGDVAPLIKGNNNDALSNDYLIGENHLAIANFGGLPSITIPSGMVNGMPVGINITGRSFDEQEVLNVAFGIETMLSIKDQVKEVGE